jgi:hypothetical protein
LRLEDERSEVAVAAARSLLRFGSGSTPLVVQAVDRWERRNGEFDDAPIEFWRWLVRLGPLARGALPRMVQRLFEEHPYRSEFNEGFAEHLDPHVWREVGRELERRLRTASTEEKSNLAELLGDWGVSIGFSEAARELFPVLRQVAGERHEGLREGAVGLLQRIEDSINDAVPPDAARTKLELTEDFAALRGTDLEARQKAACHLTFFEPNVRDESTLVAFLETVA